MVDVKATSKNVFDWEDTYSKWEYAKGYQRQLEMYQWLFRKNGFEFAPEGYLVYYIGKKNEPMFNQKLEFYSDFVFLFLRHQIIIYGTYLI